MYTEIIQEKIKNTYSALNDYIGKITGNQELLSNNIDGLSTALTYKVTLDAMIEDNKDVNDLLDKIIIEIDKLNCKIDEYNNNCLKDPLLDRLI